MFTTLCENEIEFCTITQKRFDNLFKESSQVRVHRISLLFFYLKKFINHLLVSISSFPDAINGYENISIKKSYSISNQDMLISLSNIKHCLAKYR